MIFSVCAFGFGVESVGACDEGTTVWSTMSDSRVILRSDEGVAHQLVVKVAITPAQRGAGFQHICSEWVQAWGMLFVFPTSQRFTFHMRNVKEHLDIVIIAEDGRVLDFKKMHREERFAGARRYHPNQPFRFALEAAAGRLSALGLGEGSWWLVLDPSWTQRI